MLSRQHRQTDEEPRRGSRAAWIGVAVLVFVFVLYPLSMGPALAWGCRNGYWETYRCVYYPVSRICVATGTNRILGAYNLFWCRITGTRLPDQSVAEG